MGKPYGKIASCRDKISIKRQKSNARGDWTRREPLRKLLDASLPLYSYNTGIANLRARA